jgi:Family of unknown function (DUF5819)
MTSVMKTLRAKLLKWLPAALLLGLGIHFGITLIYLTPLNPVKLRLLPLVNRYMVPFFEQRWELFAPDPLVDTRLLLVSCRLVDAQGNVEERPWSNMTSAYRDLKHRYRLTPADRIERAQFTALQLLFGAKDELVKRLLEHPDDDSPAYKKAVEQIGEEQAKRAEVGMRLMGRVASAECDRLYGQGRTKEVRVRMATIKSPPFSQRRKPTEAGETRYADFPWMTHEKVAGL